MCDESLALALAAVLLLFVVFYVLSIKPDPACFSAASVTDKYPWIDDPSYPKNNQTANWSGLDENDRTAVMNVSKNKMMLNQAPPLSMTASRELVSQEFGKAY